MENASDAIIMAGQMLVFIIALTVCITSFSNFRVQVDDIISQTETVRMARGTDGYINYTESKKNGAVRIVNADTVINSADRSLKENYVVYIKLNDNIDLTGIDTLKANEEIKIRTDPNNINETTIINKGDTLIKVTIGNNTNQKIISKMKNGLYDKIKNLEFYEFLGEYQNASDQATSSANKITFRIITYVQKN